MRSHQTLQSIASWGTRCSPLCNQTRLKPSLITRRQMQSTGTNTAILLEGRKIHLRGQVNILRGGVRLLASHINRPVEGRQGCPLCLETELHPTRRAPPARSGSRHTLQSTVRS
ncbi:hypothetical protein GWK47_007322 [Chionoecetes opilio]|uniref:Uncharacterized protein n=1 Tax=Chionoecetes opilio TaxID=41210 RepID=A0A8J5CSJ3_CHIOP|nr:hypothetical protein GWK47_007322 [Chionoecetes opilio]